MAYHGTCHDEHIYYNTRTTHVLCTVPSSFSVSYIMIYIAELHLNLHIYMETYIYIHCSRICMQADVQRQISSACCATRIRQSANFTYNRREFRFRDRCLFFSRPPTARGGHKGRPLSGSSMIVLGSKGFRACVTQVRPHSMSVAWLETMRYPVPYP